MFHMGNVTAIITQDSTQLSMNNSSVGFWLLKFSAFKPIVIYKIS